MMKDIFNMKNKVVLITGGNGHLGKAMCEILCEYGASLIIASRNNQKNLVLKKELEHRFNGQVKIIELDISNGNQVEKMIESIIIEFGKIDVLINNAYYGAGSEFLSMKEDEWYKGIDGSINACFRMTQSVLKHMKDKQYGKIINIASMYGLMAPDVSIYEGNNFYNPANYGVGKAGIIQFTKYIAAVYGKFGITCNTISPGPFPSPTVQNDQDFIDKLTKRVPLERIGIPDDLKGAVLLLASDASGYINGANISIDGGWTIW
jgi:gluconate 5-dehydrogenase